MRSDNAPDTTPVSTADEEVAAALGEAIARRIGPPRYLLWFHRHTKFTWDGDRLTVGVPNHFFQEWLANTFTDAVAAAAGEVLGGPRRVSFTIDPELFQAARREQQEAQNGKSQRAGGDEPARGVDKAEKAAVREEAEDAAPAARPVGTERRWRRLSEFAVGACNRLAHAAAVSVVEAPGQFANPLVLHGPVGTGKTHLLEGIYVGLREARPRGRVVCVTAEEFTNRFLQAMHAGKVAAFRKQFRECDVLLVDGLNFLATKRATQEEFLHTLDVLLAAGRQVVVTCDCHPKLSNDFTAELTDRLLGGAAWGLLPPDAETRLDILRRKTAGEPLPDDVLRLLAGQLRGNVRELEGAVNTIRHYRHVTGRAVDVALAREALGELLQHAARAVGLADVDRAVCRALRLSEGALQAKERAWAVSHPRMLAMYLARRHTAAAYSEIGRHFGGRNHSTVVAAEKKVQQWLQQDGELVLGERRLKVREAVARVESGLQR